MNTTLRLSINQKDVPALRRHPLLKSAKPHPQQLGSIYFDTPGLYLKRHGLLLRVRGTEDGWMQTLGAPPASGFCPAKRLESRIAEPYPDLTALKRLAGQGCAKTLSKPALADQIIPIFSTRFRRTVWQLNLAPENALELTLEQGEIRHDTAHEALSEIKLELQGDDDINHLFDFALELQNTVPLHFHCLSKAERGYRLYAPQPPAVIKAERLKLAPELTVEQGFQTIIGNCLAQVHGNAEGVTQGNDLESVHQMRVGLRRLRSVVGLFRRVAPCPAELQAELAWLTAELGAARDWEVFSHTTLARLVLACPDEIGLPQLQKAAFDVAKKNRQKAAVAVGSAQYARLLLALTGWARGARWRPALDESGLDALAAPIAKFAAKMLARYHDKLTLLGQRLQDNDARQRHRARIAAKKVRYATEFFQSLYSSKRAPPYIASLTALQDALGSINDATVAAGLLTQLVATRPDLAQHAGFVRGYLAAGAEQDVRKLGKLWQQFQAIPLPCRK